jgi:hypothetical protein
MPLGERSGGNVFLDAFWKPEKPQGVGDRRPIPPKPSRDFFLCETKLVNEALVRLSGFERIQVLSLEILHQGHLQGLGIGRVFDDGRDVGQAGEPGRPDATLAGDDLETAGNAPNHHRRQDPVFPDRGRKLLERFRIEMFPGLERVDL